MNAENPCIRERCCACCSDVQLPLSPDELVFLQNSGTKLEKRSNDIAGGWGWVWRHETGGIT